MIIQQSKFCKSKILYALFAFTSFTATNLLKSGAGGASVNVTEENRIPGFPGTFTRESCPNTARVINGIKIKFQKGTPSEEDLITLVSGPSEEDNIALIEALAKVTESEVIKIDFDDFIATVENVGRDAALQALYKKAEIIAQEKGCHVLLVFENAQKLESVTMFKPSKENPRRKEVQQRIFRYFHDKSDIILKSPKKTFIHIFFTIDHPINMETALHRRCNSNLYGMFSHLELPDSKQRQTIIKDELKSAGQKKQTDLFWVTLLSSGHSRTSLQKMTRQAISKAQQNNNLTATTSILRQELWNEISPEKKAFIKAGATIVTIIGIAGISLLGYKIGKWLLIPMKNQNVDVTQIQVKRSQK